MGNKSSKKKKTDTSSDNHVVSGASMNMLGEIKTYEEVAQAHPEHVRMATNKHLIVDDVQANRTVLRKYLEAYNFDVSEMKNGKEFVEMIDKNAPNQIYDIVWMDLKMPEMGGVEATLIARRDYKYQGVIIAITGNVEAFTNKNCLENGLMNEFLAKPIERRELAMKIKKFIDIPI